MPAGIAKMLCFLSMVKMPLQKVDALVQRCYNLAIFVESRGVAATMRFASNLVNIMTNAKVGKICWLLQ